MSDAGRAEAVTVVVSVKVTGVGVTVMVNALGVTVMVNALGVTVTVSWTVTGVGVTVTVVVTACPPSPPIKEDESTVDSAVNEVRVERAIVSVVVRMEVEKEVLIDVAVQEDIVVVEREATE